MIRENQGDVREREREGRGGGGAGKRKRANARTHQLHLASETCLLVIDLAEVAVRSMGWDLLLAAPALRAAWCPGNVQRSHLTRVHVHR